MGKDDKAKTHKLKHKSPAEFFAEHQNIAGFDNPGKSMYTSIREFVENSLDACEAVPILPHITVQVEELDEATFNDMRGIDKKQRTNANLYKDTHRAKAAAKRNKSKKGGGEGTSTESTTSTRKAKGYYKIVCKDNGIGMAHDEIPRMLGIVLSSTKYGVKQTRGKFGLGAKMALVWSKKSTGLPIEVWSAQKGHKKSYCKLDLDIHKNKPNIIVHQQIPNKGRWHGTEISIVIGGNWSTYRPKVINYLRQLAIITPYAHFEFNYHNLIDDKKNFDLKFKRRSDMLPRPPHEVKHHPSSIDNLLVETLAHQTNTRDLKNFLSKEFTKIPPKLALKLLAELKFDSKMSPKQLTKKQIHVLTTLMLEAQFEDPDGSALSPAGEYNLRLGIMKEMEPDFVSTFSSSCYSHQGHPFIIEAGVSIGGSKLKKSGLTIFRFANRIPLLFEGGNDVVNQVCNKRIKWGSYKIKLNQDKVGVFTSMVSTKIPFKGTSKEYIGDDNGIINFATKTAIEECCKQLKRKIVRQQSQQAQAEKRTNIVKYIPDISDSIMTSMRTMAGLDNERLSMMVKSVVLADANSSDTSKSQAKELFKKVKDGDVTHKIINHHLENFVNRYLANEQALDYQSEVGRKQKKEKDLWLSTLDIKVNERYGQVKTENFFFELVK